jgi:3-methylcrotonyl-CoA carboxylase alpha subunit
MIANRGDQPQRRCNEDRRRAQHAQALSSIANRGEIACRVIKTARRMGIRTVAVYSEADANARHVRLADEAVLLGPAAARESYLVADKILDAARRTGAQAVHPGYGFLSENADFADACAASGITFIGPPASAIRAMGSKSEAKKLMGKAACAAHPGLPRRRPDARPAPPRSRPDRLPGTDQGGGRRWRQGHAPGRKSEDFPDALASCKREAAASFGNEHVLIEKYITKPRHIEIQVFADTQGNCVYLFERDCSVQRRHQKVLEEAPPPA